MNNNLLRATHLTLKVLTISIALANMYCAIKALHKFDKQFLQHAFPTNFSYTSKMEEDNAAGTYFNGATVVLVYNMLLMVDVFAELELFSYIWLFLYGIFWLVAIFIAPEAYNKFPGISHVLTNVILEECQLDSYLEPIIYTILKWTCFVIILLSIIVRNKYSQTSSISRTFIIGTTQQAT